ncbi:MAG: hypothetical protein KGZ43_01305, partial [Sulfuritalea sp.]|nr:hypothetical protein [Sulfuritalea sp.]
PPVALRAPSGEPGATPSTFDSFTISQLLFQTRFNPKFVSRKIGGGSNGNGPKFVKRGRIFYFTADIDEWMNAQGRLTSTAQAKRQSV